MLGRGQPTATQR